MTKYDIILTKVKFEDQEGSKIRPVLYLKEGECFHIGSKMTSHSPRSNYPKEYQIKNWKESGLKKPTVIRFSKRVEFENDDAIKKIGHLSDEDIKEIEKLGYTK